MWNAGLEQFIEEKIKSAFNQLKLAPLNLGGVSYSGGGTGINPAGYIGQLPQTRVAFDYTEAESSNIPASGMSLLDNLNRIRHRIALLEASGVSGSSTFLGLADTPNAYSGYGGYVVAVNQQENGLTFIQAPTGSGGGAGNFLDLTDTPSSYATYSGAFVVVNGTESGLEFKNASDVLSPIDNAYNLFIDGTLAIASGIQPIVVETSISIKEIIAYIDNPGTSGTTTVSVRKNGTSIGSVSIDYDDQDKKGSTTITQTAIKGDILDISITQVADDASNLSVTIVYEVGSGIIAGGGGGASNGVSLFSVDAPPESPISLDDEFSDGVFSGWGVYNHTGSSDNLTISEQSRGLKLSLNTAYTWGIVGIYKDISSLTYPFTFFTKISANALRDQNLKAGIIICEDPTNPSARVIFVHLNTVGFESYQAIDLFSAYDDTMYTTWIQDSIGRATNHVYLKVTLYRTAPNNLYMRAGMSLDGKGWIDFSSTNALPFIAPDAIGLGMWKSSDVTGMHAYFQFFRATPEDFLDATLDGRILQL